MPETTETIDITPNFNLERIQAYADRNVTRDPQTHLTARIEVLAELSDLIDQFDDHPMTCEERLAGLVDEITRRHHKVSNELLGWFAS